MWFLAQPSLISEDSGDTGNMNEMLMADPLIAMLGNVMRKMGFEYVPLYGMVNCDSDGSFAKVSIIWYI